MSPRRRRDPLGREVAAFATTLRALRLELGMTQEALGERAGLGRRHIGLLERGQREPTLTTLFSVATALGLQPEELIHLVRRRAR